VSDSHQSAQQKVIYQQAQEPTPKTTEATPEPGEDGQSVLDPQKPTFPKWSGKGRPLESFTREELFIRVPDDYPDDLPLDQISQTTYQTAAGAGYGTVLPLYEPPGGVKQMSGEISGAADGGAKPGWGYYGPFPYPPPNQSFYSPQSYPPVGSPATVLDPELVERHKLPDNLNPYSLKYNPTGRDKFSHWLAHKPLWVSYLVVAFWLFMFLIFSGLLILVIYLNFFASSTANQTPGRTPPGASANPVSDPSTTARLIISLKDREQTTLSLPLNQAMYSTVTAQASNSPGSAQMSATLAPNALPGSMVQAVELEIVVESSHPATGQAQVPDGKASGPLRLFNPGGSGITLQAGTLVATVKGQRYLLAERVYVPPTDIASRSIGTVDARIVAEKGGPEA
jgi:hypothetical protein